MSSALAQFAQPFNFDHLQQMVVADGAIDALFTYRDPEED
jgi:hypothetical protein